MKRLMKLVAGVGIAGAMSLAALGFGSATANAAPTTPATQAGYARWGHGFGPGPWLPPPPRPAWGYDYGYYAPPCVSGPLGLVRVCP